jgi:hypothetical protein
MGFGGATDVALGEGPVALAFRFRFRLVFREGVVDRLARGRLTGLRQRLCQGDRTRLSRVVGEAAPKGVAGAGEHVRSAHAIRRRTPDRR